MTCRWAIVVHFVFVVLVAACNQSPAATSLPQSIESTTAEVQITPAETVEEVSGEFVIRNSSQDLPELLVETMDMVFEYRLGETAAWQPLASDCAFDPVVPVLVKESQIVHYECDFEQAILAEATLQGMVEIQLMGSEAIFRQQVKH